MPADPLSYFSQEHWPKEFGQKHILYQVFASSATRFIGLLFLSDVFTLKVGRGCGLL